MMGRGLLAFSILWLITINSGKSQRLISGTIRDEGGRGVANCQISVLGADTLDIISFSASKGDGRYEIPVGDTLGASFLQITHLDYETVLVRLESLRTKTDFTLIRKARMLREVTVKGPPVVIKGDTISYSPDAFKAESDRTISDVLRKLPGIQVEKNGEILYQGNPIQKYYVNGLDLMEGRYNLVNNNLPISAVKRIQVIENDQPIKILKSRSFSEKASINIQLKKFTTTGSFYGSIGVPSLLYDLNLSPMTFNKDFQVVSSVQANNIGRDLTRETANLTKSDALDTVSEKGQIAIQPMAPPPFDSDRWLNNASQLVSSNIIRRVGPDFHVKVQAGYIRDKQKMAGSTFTKILSDTNIVSISEKKVNVFKDRDFISNLVVEKNSSNLFVKNLFNFGHTRRRSAGELSLDTTGVLQSQASRRYSINNSLQALKFIGKQLFEVKSKLHYMNHPQQLIVTPVLFDKLFDPTDSAGGLRQLYRDSNLDFMGGISTSRKMTRWTVSPAFGITCQRFNLRSSLFEIHTDDQFQLPYPFANDYAFVKKTVFAQIVSSYSSDKINFEVTMPVKGNDISIKNRFLGTSALSRITFDPSIYSKFKLTQFTDLSIQASLSNTFGEPSQLYTGYILKSYRTIQRYTPEVMQNRSLSGGISVTVKDPVSLIFSDFSVSGNAARSNLMFNTALSTEGLTTATFIRKSNTKHSIRGNLGFGKYFSAINTSTKVSWTSSYGIWPQLVNDRLFKSKILTNSIILNSSTNMSSIASISYSSTINFSRLGLGEQNDQKVVFSQHMLNFSSFLFKNQITDLKLEYYTNNSRLLHNALFINITHEIKFPKRNFQIELSCNNLLNSKYFVSNNNMANISVVNVFDMRRRQLLLTALFNLN
ncbi:MAG: hypothetical protein J7619_29590 [Dyadobacter sp.]|uniref:TonB-dependent receptor n=1 Tax=Dyadobacter sp. TaxID=1914288 RepID=UPI001B1A2622|nr:hypothetical protein [Dyadobacter sp.]MBO9616876.1 hypothetical protein [Dyadobacter sp.]